MTFFFKKKSEKKIKEIAAKKGRAAKMSDHTFLR